MDHVTTFQLPRSEQRESPLFNGKIPGEIRDRILAFTLSCYNSPKAWDKDSSYVRPEYSAYLVADTSILQTCQRAYAENWFRPWMSAVHTFYLAWPGRRPKEPNTTPGFQRVLDRLFTAHGEVEIPHVRVFAQLCALEDGCELLSQILNLTYFFPHRLTVTIRHHDWYGWEEDDRLHIGAYWVDTCRFPATLHEICLELESLQRKRNQIECIADQMIEKWPFVRKDGMTMSARKEECKEDLWSGSSTWQGRRWLRDETKPGINEYFVKAITWKPNRGRAERLEPENLSVPDSFHAIISNEPSVSVRRLNRAQVPKDLAADETLRRLHEWERDDPGVSNSSDEDADSFRRLG
ncbi:hypothetical protein PV05_03505 [Exophiala xenobiotica]|uniref:Uncharacterized protein n=1 Tax=Exophiala xenobiotica TaxID=348802 RepID=A0A0D2C2K5_9EURO|nr:uncharacterized protein PV05_03505 [Exophiala xenobiotica]KIW59021.1 hypothetical protein PV05_03505 [Exophiala xenobiotica]